MLPVDAFLRALQRDIAWGFFYGTVNFDAVVGTVNHYGVRRSLRRALQRSLPQGQASITASGSTTPLIQRVFEAMLDDWTNAGFDPFAAPRRRAARSGRRTAATRRRSPGIG